MSAYLRPTAAIAADALLPEDPGVALVLAQRLHEAPLMSNHHHGLWGYHGFTEGHRELTIQATGIGAPAAAAVLRELAGHGVRRAVRLGPCTALDPALAAGDVVRVAEARGADGVSAALGATVSAPDSELGEALAAAAPEAAPVTVAGYDLEPATNLGAACADLSTAAMLALGPRLGVAIAALLVVAEAADGTAADEEALAAALLEAGAGGAEALAAGGVRAL